ncbi:DUF5060 domain-containing protein [Mucilaginibacter segetis]|uniref:DUF5060 domain-containing protein n=1 Tax=Mucilaginibacter segetis TaxID=2793071 RepID=A0A934PTK0_9SPHI|nr:DUF5060 domain-containing protein [Mucilaginibacter segetis]MBK0378911.1 DUF5060 domain-containing protein [Mucilaginibacter segetis]
MKLIYKAGVGLLFLLQLRIAAAQQKQSSITYKLLNNKVVEFERSEWDINLSAPFSNPYDQQQISLDMLLISPSGKPLYLPCYFEGGSSAASVWKARFTPQEAGEYSYHFTLKSKNGEAESASGTFTAAASTKQGFLHKNNLWTFKFDNGDLFRGIGENVGWESRSFENPKWTYNYLLPTLSKNGANFFRTWMSYWNLPLEWQKVRSTKRYKNTDEYFNPGGIKRMDQLVNMADSLHLYFMLTMDWHGLLIENGGWKSSPYNALNGGPCKTPTDFFTNGAARDRYKNKLRYIVARWGYSPNIAAFEFFNEIDNAAYTAADSVLIPQEAITEWHIEMSRYLKDIDPYKHLVTTSISHRDIIGLNSIAYIDFNQKHIYKHTEKIPGIYPDYIQTFGKPYVVGEFGYRWEDDDPKYAKEADYDYKRGLWYGMFSPTPVLPMSWWWELFDDQNMTPYFKGVRAISDMMLKAGNGKFEQLQITAGYLHSQAVKCGDSSFAYLLNNTKRQIKAAVSMDYNGSKDAVVKVFYPSSGKTNAIANFKISDGHIIIPDFELNAEQEAVLIISLK